MANDVLAHSYYFNPVTQLYAESELKGSALITLRLPADFPGEKLFPIIQRLGNYLSILSLINISEETRVNSCPGYTPDAFTCVQAQGNCCPRHLSAEEMEECEAFVKRLRPQGKVSCEWTGGGMELTRGEVEQMRRILNSVRAVLPALEGLNG